MRTHERRLAESCEEPAFRSASPMTSTSRPCSLAAKRKSKHAPDINLARERRKRVEHVSEEHREEGLVEEQQHRCEDNGRFRRYAPEMVTVNIPISEDVLERLRDLAEKTGRTVEEAAADLLASLATDEGIELTEEQEAAIEAADAEIDRGEYVTEEALFAKLRAQRG